MLNPTATNTKARFKRGCKSAEKLHRKEENEKKLDIYKSNLGNSKKSKTPSPKKFSTNESKITSFISKSDQSDSPFLQSREITNNTKIIQPFLRQKTSIFTVSDSDTVRHQPKNGVTVMPQTINPINFKHMSEQCVKSTAYTSVHINTDNTTGHNLRNDNNFDENMVNNNTVSRNTFSISNPSSMNQLYSKHVHYPLGNHLMPHLINTYL